MFPGGVSAETRQAEDNCDGLGLTERALPERPESLPRLGGNESPLALLLPPPPPPPPLPPASDGSLERSPATKSSDSSSLEDGSNIAPPTQTLRENCDSCSKRHQMSPAHVQKEEITQIPILMWTEILGPHFRLMSEPDATLSGFLNGWMLYCWTLLFFDSRISHKLTPALRERGQESNFSTTEMAICHPALQNPDVHSLMTPQLTAPTWN
ncbi:uncharacterized protein [Hemitrygon akajei]|uniref:uncharacterized protein n=1 Tax=Hemitrygon akajei TaxID=2704970 RepID=UPI003BF98EF8